MLFRHIFCIPFSDALACWMLQKRFQMSPLLDLRLGEWAQMDFDFFYIPLFFPFFERQFVATL